MQIVAYLQQIHKVKKPLLHFQVVGVPVAIVIEGGGGVQNLRLQIYPRIE